MGTCQGDDTRGQEGRDAVGNTVGKEGLGIHMLRRGRDTPRALGTPVLLAAHAVAREIPAPAQRSGHYVGEGDCERGPWRTWRVDGWGDPEAIHELGTSSQEWAVCTCH